MHRYQRNELKKMIEVRSVKNVKIQRILCIAYYVNYCFLRKAVSITTVTTVSYVTGKTHINVSYVNHSLMGMNFRRPPLNHYWPITFTVNKTPCTSVLNWCTTSPMRCSINTRRRDAATMLSNRASGVKSNLHVTRIIAIAVNRLKINVSSVRLLDILNTNEFY